ncbi:MAG: hypothetical protein WDM79_04890 [Terricaulis sp.]
MLGDFQQRARRFACVETSGGRLLFIEAIGFVLVAPVRGDADFGELIHLFGADLNLDAHIARSDHGGVDRAIAVGLGV